MSGTTTPSFTKVSQGGAPREHTSWPEEGFASPPPEEEDSISLIKPNFYTSNPGTVKIAALSSDQTGMNADARSPRESRTGTSSAAAHARYADMQCTTNTSSLVSNPESATSHTAPAAHASSVCGALAHTVSSIESAEVQLPPLRGLTGLSLDGNTLPSFNNILDQTELHNPLGTLVAPYSTRSPRSAATPIAAFGEDTCAPVSRAITIPDATRLDPPLLVSPVSPLAFSHSESQVPISQGQRAEAMLSHIYLQPEVLPQQPAAAGVIMQLPFGSYGMDPQACRLPVYPVTTNQKDNYLATYPAQSSQLSPDLAYMSSMLRAQTSHQLSSGANPGNLGHKAPKPTVSSNSKQSTASTSAAGYPTNYPIYECIDKAGMPADAADQVTLLPAASDIEKKRYATSMDERNFLTVYEYIVKEYPVIWDYYTGFVHLTGIWKMLGNTKADIVRLLDNAPDLEPHIRRVRGGFLRIQGTWLPYAIARTVATRISWPIRYALVPIFGPSFPSECLRPEDPGYGQLQAISAPKRSFGQALANISYTQASLGDDSARAARRRTSEPIIKFQRTGKAFRSSENASEELLTMLQASRSLQLLSAGPESKPVTSGADFEFGGRRYSWDGQTSLCQL